MVLDSMTVEHLDSDTYIFRVGDKLNSTYTRSGSDDRLRRYDHLKFFQHGGGRHLGFVRTVNSAVRSAVSAKHEVDRITRCRDMAIRVYWGHMEPPFREEGEVVGGQRWHH